MTAATLTLDLNTRAGRLAARAYLDALDEADRPAPRRATTPVDQTEGPVTMSLEDSAQSLRGLADAPAAEPQAEAELTIDWDQVTAPTWAYLDEPSEAEALGVRAETSEAFECIDVSDERQDASEPLETEQVAAPEILITTTDPLPEVVDTTALAADPQDVVAPEEADQRQEIAPAPAAEEHAPEREIDGDLRGQILALRAAGDPQIMIAAKLGLTAARVKTVIAEDLAAKLDAPTPPAPVKPEKPQPKPAPEPAPEPPALIPGARVVRRDIDRPWTDEIKAEVWRLHQAGVKRAEIADTLGIRADRISGFVNNIKQGRLKAPGIGSSTAIVPARSTAIAVAARPVAQDPQMVMQRREEMTDAERRKFVARSIYPDMKA